MRALNQLVCGWRGCAAVAMIVWVAGIAHGQPLTDRLPASTLVYLGWSPSAALQSTSTAKMLGDERVMAPWRRMFQDLMLEMPDGVEGGGKISEQLPALLSDAAQCEGCFALLELKQAKRHFNPQSVLMLDLGAKRKSFEEHFKPLQIRMKERMGDKLQMTKLENSWVFSKPGREGKPHITWGFIGDTFVLFTGDSAEDFIPKLIKGKLEHNLTSHAPFAESIGKISGDSIFTTYLDTRGSIAIIKRMIETEGGQDAQVLIGNWDKVLTEVGAANLVGIAEKTSIVDRQFVTRSLLRTEGPPSGLLALVAQPAVDPAMLKTIPQDAMVALAVRLDPSKLYEQIKQSAIQIGGNDAKAGFNELEQGAEGLGLPVKKALDPIGDEWVVYNAASQGGFALTGWTMVVKLRDPEKFSKNINTVRGMLAKTLGEGERTRFRTIEVDGDKVEYMEMGRWGSPIAPAWCRVDDKFIVALYPQLVEDAIRQLKQGTTSILDNSEFAAARKRTGSDGPMLYTSGPEVTRNLYPVGLLMVSVLNSFGGGFHDAEDDSRAGAADLLPSMQRLLQYVGHDALAVKTTPDGLLKTRTVGNPLLSPLAWTDSPVLWIALGIPSMTAAEDTADRVKSGSNLRQIGQAIMLYQNENKGNFPPDLATVMKTQDLTAEVIKSPFGPAKDGQDIVLVNYNGKAPQAAEVVLAYDQALLEQGEGTNVLFADGHVDFVQADNFKKTLEESRKKAAMPVPQP